MSIYLALERAKKHPVNSDIDLAIDAQKALDIGLIGQIKEEIEESTIPFFVDVVDLGPISKLAKVF